MNWRGRVVAWGMWFPPGWSQPRRVLDAWQTGARLLQAHGGMLLIFPQPVPVQAEEAAGLPVLALDKGFTTFSRGRPGPGQLLVRWRGQKLACPLVEMLPVDLAGLWECPQLHYVEGSPPAPARGRPVLPAPAGVEAVRQILPAVPPPAPQREEVLERLRQPEAAPGPRNPLLGLFDLLKSFFGSPENQQYVQKMIELFERQQFHDALRYAIPLDSSVPVGQLEKFLGLLKPRSRLEFSHPNQAGSAIGTSLQGLDLLRAIYQKALTQLVAAGRIQEAAFLQGELLNDPPGAVELLETHGLFEAAARLATLKGLPAALQVRLWFRAGQVEKALLIARRYFVHDQAILHLRDRDPKLAQQFRVAWACDLAAVARTGEALRVGWEVRDRLPEYTDWLEEALKGGGSAAVQAIALTLSDEGLRAEHGVTETLIEWFARPDFTTYERRAGVLAALAGYPAFQTNDPALKGWAHATARSLLRQAQGPFPLGDQSALSYLLNLAGDPWLKVDQPPALPQPARRLGLWRETVEKQGQTSLWDAAALEDGRMLVALGHGGLEVLSARGAVAQRFGSPAHHLVAPLEGERYLAVSGQRISCLNNGRIEAWCSSHSDGFAGSHDGYHWLFWLERQLYQIDLTDLSVWRAVTLAQLPGPIRELALGSRHLALLLDDRVLLYDYPAMNLLSNTAWSPSQQPQLLTPRGLERFQSSLEGVGARLWWDQGYCLAQSRLENGLSLLVFALGRPGEQLALTLPGATRLKARVQHRLLTVCDDRGRLLLADLVSREWVSQYFL